MITNGEVGNLDRRDTSRIQVSRAQDRSTAAERIGKRYQPCRHHASAADACGKGNGGTRACRVLVCAQANSGHRLNDLRKADGGTCTLVGIAWVARGNVVRSGNQVSNVEDPQPRSVQCGTSKQCGAVIEVDRAAGDRGVAGDLGRKLHCGSLLRRQSGGGKRGSRGCLLDNLCEGGRRACQVVRVASKNGGQGVWTY